MKLGAHLWIALAVLLPVALQAAALKGPNGGHIVYASGKDAGTVVFSHRRHGEAQTGYKCAACHPAIPEKRGTVTMAANNEGKACGTCHNGRTKAPRGEAVAFAVSECKGCHAPTAELRIGLKHMGDVVFPHSAHIESAAPPKAAATPGLGWGCGTIGKPTKADAAQGQEGAGLSCGDCHPRLFAKDTEALFNMMMPHTNGGCATCHDGKTRSPAGKVAPQATIGCSKCHLPGIQGSKS
ncbi:MAG: hypothetical protein GX774_20085 [Armatimonadetes bacterium]|nr:hypothetical protein [Armatimonadota bacterium]